MTKKQVAVEIENCIKHIRYQFRYSNELSALRKDFEEKKADLRSQIIQEVCEERGLNSESIKQIMIGE